jgi:hypothetical protein
MDEEVKDLLDTFRKGIKRKLATLREQFIPLCHNDDDDSCSSPGDTQPFTVDGPGFGREPGQRHIFEQKRLWKVIHKEKKTQLRAKAYVDLKKISLELEELRPGGIWDKVSVNSVNVIAGYKCNSK